MVPTNIYTCEDDEFKFIEETHTYTINGVAVPSVTEIIKPVSPDFSFVDSSVMDRASSFGKAVHKACELYDLDDLDESSLDHSLRPYLDAWIKFRHESGFVPTHSEYQLFSRLHKFAGTVDRIGTMNSKPAIETVILDIKTGTSIHPATGVQLAGYDFLARNTELIGAMDKVKRIAVHLKNGSYSIKEFPDNKDYTIFSSCLAIHRWKTERGIKCK